MRRAFGPVASFLLTLLPLIWTSTPALATGYNLDALSPNASFESGLANWNWPIKPTNIASCRVSNKRPKSIPG